MKPELKKRDLIIQSFELTAAAGYHLRDRWGFPANSTSVWTILEILADESDNVDAGDRIGMANAVGDIQICEGNDIPAGEEYEQGIIAALRPLVEKEWSR